MRAIESRTDLRKKFQRAKKYVKRLRLKKIIRTRKTVLYVCGSKKRTQNKHKNKKYREMEAVPLNAEIEALVNEDCDLDSLQ